MLLTMLVSGYGIYVGRFLRYNTWDILTSPFQIMGYTVSCCVHPFTHPQTYGVTIMIGALLGLVFFVFEPLMVAE